MNKNGRIAVIVVLAVALGALIMAKRANTPAPAANANPSPATLPAPQRLSVTAPPSPAASKLPRLLDIGATACIPCKLMAPILQELKTEYAGKLQIDFIDVWKDPEAGRPYGIESIPTQIFFDASGKELYRHQGFIDKADILAKCRELGMDVSQAR